MTLFTGRRAWLGVAVEATPGTYVTPQDYIPFSDIDLVGKMTPIPELQTRAIRDEQGQNSEAGKKQGEGTIKMVLDPQYTPYFLGAAMGDFGTPSTVETGVYQHTFTRKADNTPKTLSLTVDRVVDRESYTYAVVHSLDLNFTDGMVDMDVKIVSKFPSTTTSGTVSLGTERLFTFKDASVQVGADLTAAASATAINVKSFKLTIDNNTEPIWVTGDNDVNSIINKNFTVKGTIGLNLEDTTYKDIYEAFTKKAVILKLLGDAIGSSSQQTVQFNIAKIRLDDFKPKLPADDIATQEIDFTAEYSITDAKTMDIQVTNTKSSYE